ncbi:hypothetical protein [Paenibacillus elgii]|uniref:hypothetical protein n=1 Tax=Paenibacillus elgii TaxID=189691 RepID=UPI00203A4917|nr:hypothetical protein [Paenibacillus elgii]MCM3274333.1 hypothetical protein [Paenibacillus elgii]
MKRKLTTLGLTAILTIIGASSVLAVPGYSTNITAYSWDNRKNSDQIQGADTYGKFSLESKGNARAELWENCPGITQRVTTAQTTNTQNYDSVQVYMKSSCKYYAFVETQNSNPATAFVRNYN